MLVDFVVFVIPPFRVEMGLGSGRVPSFVMGCTELLATLSLYAAGSELALTFRCSSTVMPSHCIGVIIAMNK